jgi:hypothetical protein
MAMADGDNTQAGGERSGGSPVWVLMLGPLIPGVVAGAIIWLIFDEPGNGLALGLMFGIVGGVIVEQWRRDRDRGAEPPG